MCWSCVWRGDGCVRRTESAKDGPAGRNNHGALFQVRLSEVNLFLFYSTMSHNSHHARQGHLGEHTYLNGPSDMGYVVCIYTSFVLPFKLRHCLCWGRLELYGHCWCHKCPSECRQSSTVTGCPRLNHHRHTQPEWLARGVHIFHLSLISSKQCSISGSSYSM